MHQRQAIVNAQQMQQIEARLFDAGMPVAALMEKAAELVFRQIIQLYPHPQQVGVLVGPGHNGGDALVIARELFLRGFGVLLHSPLNKRKELTQAHWQYAQHLGIPVVEAIEALKDCDLIIDGLFGFGLTRPITVPLATGIEQLNQYTMAKVSVDLPSGLHTDTGEVLGTAFAADHSFCLGLWKLACFQDRALDYLGQPHLVEFGIPEADIQAVLGDCPPIQEMTAEAARMSLPAPRPPVTHKYKQGHLLLVCGSQRYAGGAILTGLGARASGVGMLSIAVPESLKPLLVSQLPEALIIACPETKTGAIASLPDEVTLENYSAIACGPGLSLDTQTVVKQSLEAPCPLILDADGLNLLAQLHPLATLSQRKHPTILTPHLGEFKRLFPDISPENPLEAAQTAVEKSQVILLLKGAKTAITGPEPPLWLIGESTPALARGGSGDVLTGLMGGLLAQPTPPRVSLPQQVATAAWWHAQAGLRAARNRSELGVDAVTLAQELNSVLAALDF
ncbi:NAD(P)H-hydrate dehydratase [Spirulina sp. CS-785/01]|uniref:NAD(P)H-hydrate dehydratase n=1 Tax=Spirulina sp. CS-785/01 TaxID=3021716 RepID=UPI00232EB846|nr:NAD(P)H-hydrate dehydratase [Spirulina sp. CS-785/01]MDB9313027.1 NAD(P)H-hydrate dehydratase [Spirulina sp. CS-785/01]